MLTFLFFNKARLYRDLYFSFKVIPAYVIICHSGCTVYSIYIIHFAYYTVLYHYCILNDVFYTLNET